MNRINDTFNTPENVVNGIFMYKSFVKIFTCCFGMFFVTSSILQASVFEQSYLTSSDVPTSWTDNLQIIPLISYSPETNLSLGVGANFVYRMPGTTEGKERTSYIQPSLVYTLNKQILADLWGEILTKDEGYYADYQLSYWRFNEYFYGVGNQTTEENGELFDYTMGNISVRVSKQVASSIYIGLQAEYYGMHNLSPRDQGQISRNEVTGSRGGSSIGSGLSIMIDKRNHLITPSSDFYFEISNFWYGKSLGSDFTFSSYFLDARKYWSFGGDSLTLPNVIAAQVFGQIVTGDPPFKRMAELGGMFINRGYYTGRFRDMTQLATQVEARFPVVGSIGITVFGAIGTVGKNIASYSTNTLRYSYGLGIRWLMNREERVNMRLDFGFVPGSLTPAMYLTLGEAF